MLTNTYRIWTCAPYAASSTNCCVPERLAARMKYCERPDLTDLGNTLSGNVADTFVNVGIELYTTKPAASDKRLIRTLDQQINDSAIAIDGSDGLLDGPHLLSPPVSAAERLRPKNVSGSTIGGGIIKRRAYSTPASVSAVRSPFGSLAEVGNVKQYAYLIAVLNASDPDRDFSALQPSSFLRIHTDVLSPLNQTIIGLGLKTPPNLWQVLEAEITPSECKAYSLELPQQFLEDDDSGISWSKMFFYFNKRRKRVLFVYLNSRPASYPREASSDSEEILGELE